MVGEAPQITAVSFEGVQGRPLLHGHEVKKLVDSLVHHLRKNFMVFR
jgi:hypothetical protein